jgi:hypothetical protein
MDIFKKDEKPKKTSVAEVEEEIDPTFLREKPAPEKIEKKEIEIGFRPRDEKTTNEEPIQPEKQEITYEKTVEKELDYKTDVLTDIYPDENAVPVFKEIEEEEKSNFKKKKKIFIKKDMIGKPIYLEDTGEKLGTVFDMIYDKENNLTGYKIKDNKSNAVLSFSIDQFDEDKNGLIFVPGWYTKAVKTIEKLEFKDRISPEFTTLLADNAVSNEELYEIFVKYDDEMAKYIEDAISLKEMLNNRLKILEKKRLSLKDNLMDLTEKRLIKDIDRREFSEDVMEHRRKVNIVDVNINKCKDLIQRLGRTSFGFLGKNQVLPDLKIKDNLYEKNHESFKEKNKISYEDEIGNPYKDKYFALKEQFEQLEDEYQELKMAVEKLMHEDGI